MKTLLFGVLANHTGQVAVQEVGKVIKTSVSLCYITCNETFGTKEGHIAPV